MKLSPFCFFFFSSRRRHTRYIGDWSSDVCYSDLGWDSRDRRVHAHPGNPIRPDVHAARRSEERRVGKECSSPSGPELGKTVGSDPGVYAVKADIRDWWIDAE